MQRELIQLYEGKELTGLNIQYKDFSQWQSAEKQKERIKEQETYWLKELGGELPILELPTDYTRPMVQDFAGDMLSFQVGKEYTDQLKTLAAGNEVTLFIVSLALLNLFLAKISGQEDIIVGTAIEGRRHEDLHQLLGIFINTLALRNHPYAGKTWREFFNQVKARTIKAYDNQDYPFEDLVEEVAVKRDLGRNPLFDVMLQFETSKGSAAAAGITQLRTSSYGYNTGVSKFDITWFGIEFEDNILFNIKYSTKLFKRETIQRFVTFFMNILAAILKDTSIRISDIDILSPGEKQQILYDFNETETEYPKNKTLHELFVDQVERTPDYTAIKGNCQRSIVNSQYSTEEGHLSYYELNEKSQHLAYLLQEKGVRADTTAAIMADRSIEMIIGLLGILKAGGAYLPLDPQYPRERIDYMLADSNTKILVTTSSLAKADEKAGTLQDRKNLEIVLLDPSTLPYSHQHLQPAPTTSLAYVIYTSGSTGRPKGVLIQHHSVVNLVFSQIRRFNINEDDRVLQFSPLSFDASVEQIFISLFSGAILVLIDKNTLLDTDKFEDFTASRSITHIHAVPSFLSNIKLKQSYRLKRILSGGDVCPVSLAGKLSRYCDFYNRYGPTETTVTSIEIMFKQGDVDETLPRLPIGKPVNNTFIHLFDKWMKFVPLAVAGEIYIGGDGVARGYLNQPELTAEKFINSKFGEGNLAHSPIYRTGDLARWLTDGNIQFLGRIDHQVKIRGIRIEPEEIESLLLKHKRVNEAVVVKQEISTGNELLCAYVVVRGSGEGEVKEESLLMELKGYLTGKLPAYMVPASIMVIEALPRTSRGKMDYDALPEPFAQQQASYTPPRDELEKSLCSLWSDILRIDIEKIGITHRFFELGGNSLNAMALISKIHKAFNVKFPLVEIFTKVTIDEQAEFIRNAQKERYAAIEAAEKKEYYVLSSAQQRIFFLHQLEPGSTFYNMSRTMVLQGGGHKELLEKTFMKLINRHESFRTSFEMKEGTPIQRIHREVPFKIDYFETGEEPDHIVKRYIRPFDLSRAPVLRVGIVHILPAHRGHPPGEGNSRDKHILIVEMHHIISDGTSMALIVKDFMELYKEDRLPPLRVQYKDFSEWRNSPGETQAVMHQEAFWLKEFEGDIPVLNLPTDYARPLVRRFEGTRTQFVIETQKWEELKTLALKEEVTMFMLLLAIFNVLLSKLSGQEDIIVGSGIEGRRHEDLRQIIGMFVNTVSLRNYPRRDKTFLQFLGEVKQRMLAAFENQDYQFEELVEKVVVNRDTGRNPLFDITFQMENFKKPTAAAAGIGVSPYTYEKNISKFDLTLRVIEAGDFLLFRIEYNTSLFEPETVERFKTYFQEMVSSVLAAPGKKLWEIGKISNKRMEEFLFHLNEELDNEVKIINNYQYHTLQDKLNNVSGLFKDHIAITYGDRYLTYSQLDNRSDYIARAIIRKGITKQTFIGMMMDDRMELITAIIGIIKAGCVFIPLDMAQPASRMEIMIRSTSVKYIISDGDGVSQRWESGVIEDCIPAFMSMGDLFADTEGLEEKPLWDTGTPGPGKQYGSEDQIYIYFTSGSTGTPKGVVGKNRSLLHFIDWEIETFGLTKNYRVSQLITPGFDPYLRDIFVPLCSGGMICIPAGKEILTDSPALIDWIEKSRVRLIHIVPSLFRLFNASSDTYSITNRSFKELKYILFSGEPIHPSDLVRWYEIFDERIQLVNLWGAAENTLAKTCYFIRKSDILRKRIPVGKPIYGARVVILDRENNICDELIEGEKYVISPYRTFGYCNDPELTKDRFLPNPFKDKTGVWMYKTGDLGRLLPGGNLEILGRNDRQVKIRGMRMELEEIESLLARHKLVNAAVVVKREISVGSELLCAYVEKKAGGEGKIGEESLVLELEGYLTGKLPAYMVPASIMVLEKIPRNSRGKVDYGSLPDPLAPDRIEYVPPSTVVEQGLSELWSQILGIEKIGVTGHFFKLGGNSLNAMALVLKIRKNFDIEFPLVEIFSQTTLEKQAAFIKSAKKQTYVSIEPVEEKEYYNLSSAQKRTYFLQQMEPGSTSYNMHVTLVLEGNLQKKRMEEAFRMLIQRHENFRTSFEMIDNTPVQRIHKDKNLSFAIAYFDPHEKEVNEIVKAFTTPFDLSQAPLLKVGLIKTGISTHILMVEIHHIISDAVSMTILKEDFTALQGKGNLPRLRLHYKDYSQWQNSEKQTKLVEKQEEYWLRVFAGEVPLLNLPLDYPRPEVQDFEGDRVYFNTGKELSLQLKEFALEKEVTLYMLYLAIFNILLHKLTGQEDLIVGTDTAGRGHADLQNVIGMFANTLALRNYPAPDKTFVSFLEEIKKRTLEAFENQDYQFERIVEQVVVNRDMSRNPLFDAAFNFFNDRKSNPADISGTAATGLIQKPYFREEKTSKFDLTLIVRESEDYLFFTFAYCTKLFKKEKIEAFSVFFEEIVSSILENPQITLGALEISLQLLAPKKEEVRLDELDI